MKFHTYFLLLFFFLSCASRPIQHKETEKLVQLKTDTITIVKTENITDTIRTTVPIYHTIQPECDSLLNVEVRNVLTNLSTRKNSGKNKYGFYYDKYKDQLIAFAHLQGKYDSIISRDNKVYVDKYVYREKPVKYIPTVFKVLSVVGVISVFFMVLKLVLFLKK